MKEKTQREKNLMLFLTMFKIGAFTFGGYAMISLLEIMILISAVMGMYLYS